MSVGRKLLFVLAVMVLSMLGGRYVYRFLNLVLVGFPVSQSSIGSFSTDEERVVFLLSDEGEYVLRAMAG